MIAPELGGGGLLDLGPYPMVRSPRPGGLASGFVTKSMSFFHSFSRSGYAESIALAREYRRADPFPL